MKVRKKYITLIQNPRLLTWLGIEWEKKEEEWMPPVDGVITSYCGERENPILHKQEIHDGVDIAVAEGTEVRAVKSGTVTEVRTSDTYGNLMKYETEDGYEVMYAHLSKVMVKEGEKIKQGQIVAKSGNTGLSTGPHLHYGIYQKGKLVDPLPFLSADAMV